MRVLVVEDDAQIASFLVKGLKEEGHAVDSVAEGRQGLFMATTEAYAVIVLDRMLPGGLDGLGLLTALRAAGVSTPVLILSALSALDERVRGLRAGGDDYLTKPFEFIELTARLDALNRRRAEPAAEARQTRLRVASLEIDLLSRTVRRGDRVIELVPREYALLEYLMRNAGQVITRTMLLESVWNYHFDPQTNVIDVHISRLRGKVDKGFEPPLIHTVRGVGYSLTDAPERLPQSA